MQKALTCALGLGLILLSSAAASAQSLQPVVFAWTANPQTPQVDLALKNDLFKQAGLDVKLVSFPTGREAVEALLGGQADFAYMAEFPLAASVLRGQGLRILVDLSRYKGNRIIASAKSLDIKSAKDLAGKKIGTTMGTNSEFFTDRLLANAGAKAQVINAGPADLLPALLRGDIDAAIMFPTFFDAAKKALGSDYRELISQDYILHSVVSTSTATMEKQPDVIAKFIDALIKADALVQNSPAAAQEAMAANLKNNMTLSGIQTMWSDFDFGAKLDGSLLDLLTSQGGWMVGRGVIKAARPTAATYRPFLLDAPLKAIAPDRVNLP